MALAEPEEPLRLADGTLVYSDKVVSPDVGTRLVEIPSNREAQQLVLNTRRQLADLPDVPRTLNAVSVITAYTLFGLADEEISLATNLSIDQIKLIRSGPAYQPMMDAIIKSVLEAESAQVRDIFVQHSRKAAHTFTDAMDGHNVSTLQFAAASQILDRAGHRPADIVEHRVKTENSLVIEIIRKDDTKQPPVIDMGL